MVEAIVWFILFGFFGFLLATVFLKDTMNADCIKERRIKNEKITKFF